LRLNKINPMLLLIDGALIGIKFKFHNCIKTIPFPLLNQLLILPERDS
jgi:hypothetical protein